MTADTSRVTNDVDYITATAIIRNLSRILFTIQYKPIEATSMFYQPLVWAVIRGKNSVRIREPYTPGKTNRQLHAQHFR